MESLSLHRHQSCIGINLGPSPFHARNVHLILNLQTDWPGISTIPHILWQFLWNCPYAEGVPYSRCMEVSNWYWNYNNSVQDKYQVWHLMPRTQLPTIPTITVQCLALTPPLNFMDDLEPVFETNQYTTSDSDLQEQGTTPSNAQKPNIISNLLNEARHTSSDFGTSSRGRHWNMSQHMQVSTAQELMNNYN